MLDKKIIVITGGAGLLGQEFIRSVSANNATAIIADLDIKKAKEIQSKIKYENPNFKVEVEKLNITSTKSINSLISVLKDRYGKIDALVNNAYPRNKNYGRHFFDVEYDDFCENLGLNLGGYFLTSKLFSKFFCEQGHGNIINISSIYGVVPPKFEIYEGTGMTMPVEYAAIKSGLIHLTKYMAKYFKGKNIRVNSISLGGIEDKQPQEFLKAYKKFCLNKGILEDSDISGTLIYLLSGLSEFVNGQNIVVDDGFTL